MNSSDSRPIDNEDRKYAAKVAKRIAEALRAAETLQRELENLVADDPKFAPDWSRQVARAKGQVNSLRKAQAWADKAARGESPR